MFQVLPNQDLFLRDLTTAYLLYVGGYGAGKTNILVKKAIYLAYLNAVPSRKGSTGALYEPTFDMITDLLIPELEEQLDSAGIKYRSLVGKSPKFIIDFPHGRSIVLLKSFENWRRLVGGNYAWAGVDEMDTIDKAIAEKSWKKLIGRVRVGRINQIFVTTTPEGYKFCYEFWERNEDECDRKIIRVSTLDNPFLSEEYIDSLYRNYPANLINAYVFGKFVNLETGSVYHQFDKELNATDETVKSGEPLHIGMDFNIGRMAAVVHVLRDGLPRAVDEICHWYDTPSMISEILDRYPNHHISVYPDASGKARDTNGSKSDFELLKQAGFEIVANLSNPSVKDRIVTMNAAFCNALGERRYLVNVDKCPIYTTCLQQQALKNGVPVKDGVVDHANDSGGYVICTLLPIKHEEPYTSSFL